MREERMRRWCVEGGEGKRGRRDREERRWNVCGKGEGEMGRK
jgi:hypothetical protein